MWIRCATCKIAADYCGDYSISWLFVNTILILSPKWVFLRPEYQSNWKIFYNITMGGFLLTYPMPDNSPCILLLYVGQSIYYVAKYKIMSIKSRFVFSLLCLEYCRSGTFQICSVLYSEDDCYECAFNSELDFCRKHLRWT
jgi:hypothetical protein